MTYTTYPLSNQGYGISEAQHPLRALQDSQRLQTEIQQLNDTVFSKSFKPPSAWADREVKYKMEKRAWEQEKASLKEQMAKLKEENRAYRESNKAAEFEKQVQVGPLADCQMELSFRI